MSDPGVVVRLDGVDGCTATVVKPGDFLIVHTPDSWDDRLLAITNTLITAGLGDRFLVIGGDGCTSVSYEERLAALRRFVKYLGMPPVASLSLVDGTVVPAGDENQEGSHGW